MKTVRPSLLLTGLIGLTGLAAAAGCTSPTPIPGRPPTSRPTGGPTTGHEPVIFIHGYTMQNSNMWATAKRTFQGAGYGAGDLSEFNYNSTGEGARQSAAKLAPVLNAVAAKSPTGKVDIVAHSEGNLVAETCFLLGGCAGKVDHWVNLAGAQNGTNLSPVNGIPNNAAADMNPRSGLVRELNSKEDEGIAQQGIKTIVFWTDTDGVIIPGDLCKERFAKNVRFTGTHLTVWDNASVLAQSLEFLRS